MNGNISIGTRVRLTIDDDPQRVITFNPNDVTLAERVYTMLSEYQEKEKEYRGRAQSLQDSGAGFAEQMSLVKEIAEDMNGRIDAIFGEGTSKAAFGDAIDLSMIEDFFEGIIPYLEQARKDKLKKYETSKPGRALK